MKKSDIYIYLKDGVVSMWQKHYIWHKWQPKTTGAYAREAAKYYGKEKAYGPCWWGMHDEAPEEHGYSLVGIIKDEDNAQNYKKPG
jgi:hypothetical protein